MSAQGVMVMGLPANRLAVPALVLLILAMMVLPLPTFMLDVLFTLNIALAMIVLLVSLNARRPLDFSVFPTVLLLTTLLRLSLNVASTRIILMQGHTGPDAAGKVIESFGNFLVGGNYRGRLRGVHHPRHHQLRRHHQGCRAHCRGGGTLHPGFDAGQAAGGRRRSERRLHQRRRSACASQRYRPRIRLLWRDGRRFQVRARRCHRRHRSSCWST